jgi:TPR repeat protein
MEGEMRALGLVVGVICAPILAFGLGGAGASAQDENPTTPGAIPNPGSYQGSMELQRRSDEQDQQFRQQQQNPAPYQQPRYNTQPGSAPRGPSAMRQYESRSRPDASNFGKASPGELAAEAALHRGDMVGAVRLWRPLAAAGDVNAQYNLGVMYEQGHGVPTSAVQAAYWYRKAAERGMPTAMLNLGSLIMINSRGPADLIPAYKWYAVAATHAADRQTAANARHNMGLIAPMMSRSQIALAQAQARAWRVP